MPFQPLWKALHDPRTVLLDPFINRLSEPVFQWSFLLTCQKWCRKTSSIPPTKFPPLHPFARVPWNWIASKCR